MFTSFRRKYKRWLYGRCPGFRGSFRYYGAQVYFPPDSLIFALACDQGIYEAANLRLLLSSLRPGTTFIDAGANIGLMSVPLLSGMPNIRGISIEASPSTFAYLAKTVAGSGWQDRWTPLSVAVGDRSGSIDFYCADPSLGAFDGVKDTHRAGPTNKVTVPLKTIDEIWLQHGRPDVCVIKIDVEGSEAAALRGAGECVRHSRPTLLVEWNTTNLTAFGCAPEWLLSWCQETGYEAYAMPELVPIRSQAHLRARMGFDESFALLPSS